MRNGNKPVFSFFKAAVAAVLILACSGCSSTKTVVAESAVIPAVMATADSVAPGDSANIHYICRLKSGAVAAATSAVSGGEKVANIFTPAKDGAPQRMDALNPDEPFSPQLWPDAFEDEIVRRLQRGIAGMKTGEKRRMTLTAQPISSENGKSGVVRLVRVRTRPREVVMPRKEYEVRARKTAEAGQMFVADPAFPGRVESVTDQDVTIRFSAKPGSVVETPFGTGVVRDDGKNYLLDIDARPGSLVRTGKTIGRITGVSDTVITVDYRHPFGYEELICDVTVVDASGAKDKNAQNKINEAEKIGVEKK